jgi:hypothetical protein
MCSSRTLGLSLIILGTTLAGCSSHDFSRVNFLNQTHRQIYAIENWEFKKLQFYVSTEILAHAEDPVSGSLPAADRVIVMQEETPGVVKEVGPDWLRVSFEKGGPGLFFLTDPRKDEDLYWLATRRAGRSGLYKVKNLVEKVVLHEGVRYRLINGADASLLVDGKSLRALIDSRTHVKGRKVEQPR